MAAMKLVYPIRSPRLLVVPSACNIGLFIVVLLSIWFYRSWARHRHIRGPLLASISNIPRLRWAWSGKAHEAHIRLHEKYGKLVRIGPNSISVGDPREIAKIYGIGANLCKVSQVTYQSIDCYLTGILPQVVKFKHVLHLLINTALCLVRFLQSPSTPVQG